MPELSAEQQALKASIRKSALIWGLILGALVGGFVYMLNDELAQPLRSLVGGGVFAVIAGVIFVWRSKANAGAATCKKCNAAFSISRTDRSEKTLSSEPKETRDAQPDHSTKVTTWLEEVIETTDTYTCSKCGDITTKVSTRTEKKDLKEEIEPAPQKEKPAAVSQKAAPDAGKAKAAAPKAGGKGAGKKKPAAAKAGKTGHKSAPEDEGGYFSEAKAPASKGKPKS